MGLGIEGVESGNTVPRTGIKGECIRISYFFEGSDTCVPSLQNQGQNLLCFWNQGSEFWVQEMGSVLKKYTLKSCYDSGLPDGYCRNKISKKQKM